MKETREQMKRLMEKIQMPEEGIENFPFLPRHWQRQKPEKKHWE